MQVTIHCIEMQNVCMQKAYASYTFHHAMTLNVLDIYIYIQTGFIE